VQSYRNRTAIHREKLQWIALDCTELRSIAPKNHWREKQAGRMVSLLLSFCLYLFACKVAESSRLLALKAQWRNAAATFPGSLVPAPHKPSETLNLVGFNLRQSKLIQVNPT
jgi:hypothetical protein